MARIGINMKWTAPASAREAMGAMFRDVLGADVQRPAPAIDLFLLEGGARVGVYYVAPEQALDPTVADRAPWLEFLVDDPSRARARLAGLGIEPFEYTDKEHDYFRAPGGQVFRLGRAGA